MTERDDEYQKILDRLRHVAGASGLNSLDPTINVQQLVNAAVLRLDDLSERERSHRQEVRELEARHLDDQRTTEKERVNALLSAAAAAAALDRTRVELTAAALAERVDTTAKTIASQVESTARAAEGAVIATAAALNARIVPLEQARFEQAGGKQQASEVRDQRIDTRQQGQYTIYIFMAAIAAATFVIARFTP